MRSTVNASSLTETLRARKLAADRLSLSRGMCLPDLNLQVVNFIEMSVTRYKRQIML
jgi:hypothetical protein